MRIKIFYYLIFLQSYIQAITSQTQIDFVFNSIPYQTFDVQSKNGTSNTIKVAQNSGIAVAAVGYAGIMIIDQKFKTQIFPSPDKSYIQCIQISKNSDYILLGMINQVGIFKLNQIDFSISMINSISMPNTVIVGIEFNLQEDVLFILGYYGLIEWYDARNITTLNKLGELIYPQMVFARGIISPDNKFFYVIAYQDGLLCFKIDEIQIKSNLTVNLTRILYKPAISSFTELAVTSKNQYIFAIDKWDGVYLLYDLSQLLTEGDNLENKNNNKIQLVQANLGSSAGYTSSIGMSSDDQFLFIGARSIGILIYNIADPLNPIFFQQLKLSGQSFSLCLSPKLNKNLQGQFDNQYIYYSNSLSVSVYQKQKPSLYNYIPNLFNLQQSQFFVESDAASKWRCKVSANSKYLLAAFDTISLSIFKISLNSYTKSSPSKLTLQYQFSDSLQQLVSTDSFRVFGPNESIPMGFYIDDIQFTKDEQYIIFPSQQVDINIIAYKFKVIKSDNGDYSFQYVQGLKFDNVYYCEEINLSEDEQHAVMAFTVGIVLVDVQKFEVISMYTNPDTGTCCGAVFSHDTKYALSVVRNIGLYIYDTSDMKNPKMVNQWRTNGGETLLRSKNDKIIYFVDGFNGLVLLDSTQLPKIVVVGKFPTSGWANYISFTLNEIYGIISTMDTGTLTLIDLSDKHNPRVIMTSTVQSQDSITSCIDPTGLNFIFSADAAGVRLYNLQSSVSIHVEREVQSIQTNEFIEMSNEDPFQIGLKYRARFVQLYRKPNQIINQIYYYQNLELKTLPSWMLIDNSDQSNRNLQTLIQIDVPKECLDSQGSNISFLTIVIQTCFQLDNTSFIFDTSDVTTTSDESDLIFTYLKQNGYLDGSNCATNFFDPIAYQYFNLSNLFKSIDSNRLANIQSYVTETYKRTIVYNQFVFDVVSSLQFNQNNSQQMISAIQNDISVSFSFPDGSQYVFIQKIYPNLIMYFNDQQTVIKIEGDLKYVNQALSNGILYFDKTKQNNQTFSGSQIISIQIVDKFNYDLNFDLQVGNEVKFLKLKQNILKQKGLQQQVNDEYQGADLTINESFLIQFDVKSFIDPDQISLTYEFLQEINGQYVPLSSDSFIKCDNINLRLVGTPPSSYLFKTIYLRLQITNGYDTIHEDFYFNISIMPFSYVLNILIQILGPLAFAFGFYKKRMAFMNFYFRDQTMYSTETVYVNQIYTKKISILDQDYEVANQFFHKYVKQAYKVQKKSSTQLQRSIVNKSKQLVPNIIQLQNKDQTQELDQQFQQQSPSKRNDVKVLNIAKSEYLSFGQRKNSQLEQNADQKESQMDNIRTNRPENDTFMQNNEDNDQYQTERNSVLNNQKNVNQDLIKRLKDQTPLDYDKLANNLQTSNIQLQTNKDNSNQLDQVSQSGNLKNVENKNYICVKLLTQNQDGTFHMDNLFKQIIKQKLTVQYNMLDYKIERYAKDLKDKGSKFYYCLKANVLRYLIDNDKITLNAYQTIKKYALEQGKYLQNDWYKMYVEIIPTNQSNNHGVPTSFPLTNLKEDQLFDIFKIVKLIPENISFSQFQSCLNQLGIDFNLIKEVLFADTLGLNFISAKKILRCCGESLHLQKNQILSVEAYEKIEEGLCLGLRKIFNLQYKSLPMSKYNSLPNWMSYDCKSGVIFLEGIPIKSDINSYLIRVYDQSHFICYQYHLDIQEDPNLYDVNQSYLNSSQPNQITESQAKQRQNLQFSRQQSLLIARQSSQKQDIQMSQYFKKQKNVQEFNTPLNSLSQSLSNQINFDITEDNNDTIQDKIYLGIKSLEEHKNELGLIPIFTHSPSGVKTLPK
ncbi:two component regulator propeller family protein (macronuclear) [Tetrahymena thermophila SB210]|uniref:Two component regulator propeller family protein n=1 Tax=Tetrahymena thermophila (strain SB210) TaxID=312017 RepID=I7MFR3_TETTS|nr:two component regulator propeller family protein [Tetrahymena thermophila SB210]EAS00517.2 two component regulator propeller family protein [Tetrahymena thermophila SB210]|eukprot:XP_001020762.2 two component regulator propeller family protein [Tetrahymena thermophila SB210]